MPDPLKVLIVEDSENDALLLEIELQRAGYVPSCRRVETREAMEAALQRERWDVVIADYVMPKFHGLEALELVKSQGLDLPFIIVSGHITEGTAVSAMKAGAHDYVMKGNLARLGPAVERELREAEVRRASRRADEKLKVEQVFRQAIEHSVPAGITAVDLEGRQTYVNPAFCAMVGWRAEELLGAHPPFLYWPPGEIEGITEAFANVLRSGSPPGGLELRFRKRTGERVDVFLQITPLRDSFGNITGWVSSVSDITERKRARVRLAAEHTITRLLAGAQSLEEAASAILESLVGSLEVDVGVLWMPGKTDEALHATVIHLACSTAPLEAFKAVNCSVKFGPGVGLPGQVWQERKGVWHADFLDVATKARRQTAQDAALQSGMAFPIQSTGTLFGVMEFFALRRLEPDPILANMMGAIGSEIGQFIQRRRAEEALRRAHDELELRVQQRTGELKSANTKLQAAMAERRRLENELLEITEQERRRIGLDLHDDLGQKLSGIALMTKGLQLKLAKQQTGAVQAEEAGKIHQLIQEAMTHASDVAHDLATLEAAQKDLPTALEHLAERARELFRIGCRFKPVGKLPSLEPPTINQLYKIAQEALTNAIKHGKAKQVGISLANGSDQLRLTVQSDGRPFPDLRGQHTGMGLRIMNYRASLIGASLEVKANGAHGTRVTCELPLK
jgi:PAS domain S-box-containing protein